MFLSKVATLLQLLGFRGAASKRLIPDAYLSSEMVAAQNKHIVTQCADRNSVGPSFKFTCFFAGVRLFPQKADSRPKGIDRMIQAKRREGVPCFLIPLSLAQGCICA